MLNRQWKIYGNRRACEIRLWMLQTQFHRKTDVKSQIESKETFIKYVVKFVSTLQRHQHLLPRPLALWLWPGGCSSGWWIPVPGGVLGLPGSSGSLPMALLPLLLRLGFVKFPDWADEVQMWEAFQGGWKEEDEGKNRKFLESELRAGKNIIWHFIWTAGPGQERSIAAF